MVCVLISDISSYKAIVVARFLKETYSQCRIVAFDTKVHAKWVYTKFVDGCEFVSPGLSEDDYIAAVRNIIKTFSVDIFLPIASTTLDKCLKRQSDFGDTLSYWGPYETYNFLNDKGRLEEFSRIVRVPDRYGSLCRAKIPFVVKPRIGSSSEGVRYVCCERDYKELCDGFENDTASHTMQAYVDGQAIGYSVYAEKGTIKESYCHRRLVEYPLSGGSSVYREKAENSEVEKFAAAVIAQSGWSGFAMCEFKVDDQGRAFLIEINPRIWGSINQGLQNGVNYFVHLLSERGVLATNPTIGLHDKRTYVSPLIYFCLVRALINGNGEPFRAFLRAWKRNKSDVPLLKDSAGWLSFCLRVF